MDTFLQDLRYSFRALLAKPGFTIAAILTLALGIGANTAIFSIIDNTMMRPMPYPADHELVRVYNSYPKMGLEYAGTSIPDYMDRKSQADALENLTMFTGASFNLANAGSPERLVGLRATPSMFQVLRVAPMLGRAFGEDDAIEGKDHVAVLSYALWQKLFQGSMDVVGKELRLNGTPYQVIGVMPEAFFFPNRGNQLWVPFTFKPAELTDEERGNEYSDSIGRLKPGASIEQLNAQMDAIVARNAERIGKSAEGASFAKFLQSGNFQGRARQVREMALGETRQTLYLLQAVTLFVLLIACANVANLMLTRVSARQRELSVRSALGAGRWRIARQLLSESLLLSIAGAALGVLMAYFGMQGLATALGFDVENGRFEFHMDGTVLVFSAVLALGTGVLFGLAPVLSLWQSRPYEVLKEGGRSGGGGRSARATRNALVVVQMALAVTLLIGAGLLLRSFSRLSAVQPGFQSEGVLTANLALPDSKYKEDVAKAQFYERLLSETRAIPGVTAAGLITGLPFSNNDWTSSYSIEGREKLEGVPSPHGHARVVDEGYLKALQIPLLQGRGFQPTDTAGSERVVLIDEYLARTQFPNESPIGKRITNDDTRKPDVKWWTIVGVVGTVKHEDLAKDVKKETYYYYYKQNPAPVSVLTLRSNLPMGSLVEPVREALRR